MEIETAEFWSAEEKHVVAKLEPKFRQSPKFESCVVYDRVFATKARNGKLYLSCNGKSCGEVFTAREGSVVIYKLAWGSRRHTHSKLNLIFRVREGEQGKVEDENVTVTYENLQLLPQPTKEDLANAEATIKNAGYEPTKYAPIRTIVHTLRDELVLGKKREECRPEELAVLIIRKVLSLRPEVLAEIGYDVDELRRVFAVEEVALESRRAKLLFTQSPPR